MRSYLLPLLVTAIALVASAVWAGPGGLFVCALLIVMEISFSFDNAVVNATVLKTMDARWRQRFLTWGMLIAVFGMYLLFPVAIVAIASGNGLGEVVRLALHQPELYRHHLEAAQPRISAFGGMFLLMVFLTFITNEDKTRHWLGRMEATLSAFGKLESVEIVIALSLLLGQQAVLPQELRLPVMLSGVFGIVLYVGINGVTCLFAQKGVAGGVTTSGLAGFFYLNLLDASFSLDAVVGSFALSHDILIIMLGLSAGAMFIRSLTVHMVRQGTLDQYIFLEHGAHWGIGALAVIMLVSILTPVPQTLTGLVGLAFILLSLFSSIRRNQKLVQRSKG